MVSHSNCIGVARGPAGPVLAGPLFSAEFIIFLRGGQLTIERTLTASTNHGNKHGYISATDDRHTSSNGSLVPTLAPPPPEGEEPRSYEVAHASAPARDIA